MPSRAPLPTPTIIAVGVARPRAQGQAITRMPTNEVRPYDRAMARPSVGALKSQIARARTASAKTIGTNTAEILSAKAWMGARLPWAASTMLMIWASKVSAPTLVAVKVKEPVVLIVPATTASPAFFSIGIGSPVTIDSSTKDEPSATRPSTGSRAPGLITIISPWLT